MSSDPPDSEHFVSALARGLAVIEAFGNGGEALTLSEVARRADISRAAARRLLLTLVALGYAAFDGKLFSLLPRVLALGFAYLSSVSAWDVAQPLLQELVRETGESGSAAVLDGQDIVHVIRMPSARRLMSITVKAGDRLPAHASAMGRVLLAALPPPQLDAWFEGARLDAITARTVTDPAALRRILDGVRAQGWAEVDGELDIGLKALAVPVTDRDGVVVGAIALSTPSTGTGAAGSRRAAANPLLEPLQRFARRIREAAAALPRLPAR
jgi:IclR family pca regulon transcriptional regulator